MNQKRAQKFHARNQIKWIIIMLMDGVVSGVLNIQTHVAANIKK
jgi:hypothetical protein